MTVTGPDFLALQVRDVDAAAEFFERHLGHTRAPAGPSGAVVFGTTPIPFAVRAPLPGTDLEAGRAGLGVALWFGTDDADALHERLAGAGIPIADPPRDSPFGRTFTFTGPEGYLLTAHDG